MPNLIGNRSNAQRGAGLSVLHYGPESVVGFSR